MDEAARELVRDWLTRASHDLPEEARLKPEQAEQYLREVRKERLAAEDRRPA